MFHNVNAIVLFVQNFDKSLTFYRDVIGLEVAQLEPQFAAFKMYGQDFALLDIVNGADMLGLEVAEFEPQTGKADRVLLCVDVEDVDAEYERLTAKGVPFSKAPVDQSWGIRAAYFRDPEGNIWELKRRF